jgi:hypothetical protein
MLYPLVEEERTVWERKVKEGRYRRILIMNVMAAQLVILIGEGWAAQNSTSCLLQKKGKVFSEARNSAITVERTFFAANINL